METICQIYRQAQELENHGIHVVSTDEKTGIQALERGHPTRPMRPGTQERIEFEYIRNGTLCLTANFHVATGRIVSPTIAPTRNEQDFADHIARTIAADPKPYGYSSLISSIPINRNLLCGLWPISAE